MTEMQISSKILTHSDIQVPFNSFIQEFYPIFSWFEVPKLFLPSAMPRPLQIGCTPLQKNYETGLTNIANCRNF